MEKYFRVDSLFVETLNAMRLLLDEYMHDHGLTERQVSAMTGLSHSTVHEIRKGAMPRVDTLELLAKGLQIRMFDLTI